MQASLGATVKPGRNVLMVKQDDMETEFALCSLTEGKLECTPLDLYFRDETVNARSLARSLLSRSSIAAQHAARLG